MFFKIWWNEIGRRLVSISYYGSILGVGLFTGIVDIKIIPLVVIISLFFGIFLVLWFILLEKLGQGRS